MPESAASPDPAGAPWPLYARAVVELILDGEHLVLTPVEAEEGLAHDRRGTLDTTVWVLTAGDPYPVALDATENAARNAGLVAELEAQGLRCDPALGRSSDGSASERSIAVRGGDRAMVLAAADRYGQLAVYEIDDRIRCVDVASGAVVTARAFGIERAPAGSGLLVGPTGWEG